MEESLKLDGTTDASQELISRDQVNFFLPVDYSALIEEQLIGRAIGGDTMDRFLHYVVKAVHCLKWSNVWATYSRKQRVELKAKLIDAALEKNSSSSPHSAKMRKKMEREYEETVTARNQLLKLYNRVRLFSLHGT